MKLNYKELLIEKYPPLEKYPNGMNSKSGGEPTGIKITHFPTKTTVICESERSQLKNKIKAEKLLVEMVLKEKQKKERQKNENIKSSLWGRW